MKINMNSKTKILIGILVAGVVLIGGFLYFHLFFNCVGEMQEIKPGQHCCFGLKAQRISIPAISNKPQFYCVPPKMEESVKNGNSILRLKKLCLLNGGRKFNTECKNKEVILNNLWLYPVKEKEKLTDRFYLYSSDTFSGVSPIAVSGELSLMESSFITVYTEDNQDLFEEIKNKTKAIEKPIPVTIKGVIKPSELCTQNAPCRYGLFIAVQNISYESTTKTDREVIITTDKTEYEREEMIKITLENNLNESIYSYGLFQFGCGALYLQKEDLSGDWKDVDTFICPVPMLPSVIEYKAGEKKSYYFNQKIDYEQKVLAKPGRYRFKFIYYIKCESQGSDNSLIICPSQNKKTIYSNEFIIKEPTSKKCIPEGGTLFPNDGNKCCVGLSPRWNYEMQEDGSCKSISGSSGQQLICIKCGNGICGKGENGCNCPKDCKDFKCKEHGEIPIFFPGDDMSIQCCKGLKHRLQKEYFDENCTNLFEKYGGGGYAGICLACGDGICDEKFESKCNCPEDCK